MKIGIIYVGYQTEEYIDNSLAPWFEAKKLRVNDNDFCICAVSTSFLGFDNNDKLDNTIPILTKYLQDGKIDYLITEPKNIPEIQARGMALKYLIEEDCEIVWQVDSDEFYTLGQIGQIAYFVELNPFIMWFRLNLRNYVFTDKEYLSEPFTPPRIHRISSNGFIATSFNQDNNIAYGGFDQQVFANMTIPMSIAYIKHITWLNNERSRKKVEYQKLRWGHCSFRWNEKINKLEFDPDFYKKTGQSIPKIITEGC